MKADMIRMKILIEKEEELSSYISIKGTLEILTGEASKCYIEKNTRHNDKKYLINIYK